jgi:hypothetical protein
MKSIYSALYVAKKHDCSHQFPHRRWLTPLPDMVQLPLSLLGQDITGLRLMGLQV